MPAAASSATLSVAAPVTHVAAARAIAPRTPPLPAAEGPHPALIATGSQDAMFLEGSVSSTDRVGSAEFGRKARVYLPWMCGACSFENTSFPSVCEVCETPNPRHVFSNNNITTLMRRLLICVTMFCRICTPRNPFSRRYAPLPFVAPGSATMNLALLDRLEPALRERMARQAALVTPATTDGKHFGLGDYI